LQPEWSCVTQSSFQCDVISAVTEFMVAVRVVVRHPFAFSVFGRNLQHQPVREGTRERHAIGHTHGSQQANKAVKLNDGTGGGGGAANRKARGGVQTQ
jgi:hypothetical protein